MELVKFTGKFIPLQDFYHFDEFNILSGDDKGIIHDAAGSRYDDQIALFGREAQETLQRMK